MNKPKRWPATDTEVVKGVHLLGPVDPHLAELYEAVRSREHRIHVDEIVKSLPYSGTLTAQASEWRIRARSLDRLTQALSEQGAGLRLLDIGCGNGWMSAALARAGHSVVALDMHRLELEQAARVFTGLDVTWCLGDPRNVSLPADGLDAIILAASIQYFDNATALLERLKGSLLPGGIIHVLDTVLYTDDIVARSAQERSIQYYTSLGVPGMAAHYHAHCLQALRDAGPLHVLDAPAGNGPLARLFGRGTPFHHVSLRRTAP